MKTAWVMSVAVLSALSGCAPLPPTSKTKQAAPNTNQGTSYLVQETSNKNTLTTLENSPLWEIKAKYPVWTGEALSFSVRDEDISCPADATDSNLGEGQKPRGTSEFIYQRQSRTLVQRSTCRESVTLQLGRDEAAALEAALQELVSLSLVAKVPRRACNDSIDAYAGPLYSIQYEKMLRHWPASLPYCQSGEVIAAWDKAVALLRQYWYASL